MTLIEWSDEKFSIGIKELDDQHKVLVDYINQISDAIIKNHNDLIAELFTKLFDYTEYHFKEEQKYFNSLSVNDLTLHKLQHKHLLEDIRNLKEEKYDPKKGDEIIFFLGDWIINHVIAEDRKLKE